MKAISYFTQVLALAAFVTSTPAQEVSIPDPGLNAAIRAALQKPNGPLTPQDLLQLTELNAASRNITNLLGLEAARNLFDLDLHSNRLANVSFPSGLTNLNFLDLSLNPLTNCTFPNGLTNLKSLTIESSELTSLTVPVDMTGLIALDLFGNRLSQFNLPANLTNLDFLAVSANQLTNVTLPPGLAALTVLELWGNGLTNVTLPEDMTNLLSLTLFFNQLTDLKLPANLRSLGTLDASHNQLTSLTLPPDLAALSALILRGNQLSSFTVPAGNTNLQFLFLNNNQLTNVTLPAGLAKLSNVHLNQNRLASFHLPVGMIGLKFITLGGNQLTNLTLPADLASLVQLDLQNNQLTTLTLPSGLTNLVTLVIKSNLLTSLTLPPDVTRLGTLLLDGNPFLTLVLSEPLAATSLAGTVASLENQGVPVFTYPLAAQLVRPLQLVGAFKFGITGPPGEYTILESDDLVTWRVLGVKSNPLGSVNFTDVTAHLSPKKFYRALLQSPPANMVFVPPNTFIMGSPPGELHRQANEGPQTTVTLSRGFWIGKYEVTQREYLDVTGTNPSEFPGDLSRPVSSVSWPDATNYCAKLTERELAAGRIPPGSRYRLPTEAEWECAARAGTTTRFSYGDDPDYTSLTNYAWQSLDDGLTVHPVGQKLPNPWGLFDMAGNVFEWCEDWLGPLPGGLATDPHGPPSNPIGWKIMRGGAFDFGGPSCRSASRMFFGNHPALTDSNLGFRVVLVAEP